MVATLSIATWNINSVRLRIDQVLRFLDEAAPDALCLQEIKCTANQFPLKAFAAAGYPHAHVAGQKGMHGVAIVSRQPLEPLPNPGVCRAGEARAAIARIAGVEIQNYYVPAGGDEPDPAANPKFAHKLDFIGRLTAQFNSDRKRLTETPVVITGDLNIAPSPYDVWSHKQLLTVVSHTPVETEGLNAAQAAGGFTDIVRTARPEPASMFSWWSYRAKGWRKSNRGRRLDHIWLSPALAQLQTADADAVTLYDHTRDWEKPSDHIPIQARLRLSRA